MKNIIQRLIIAKWMALAITLVAMMAPKSTWTDTISLGLISMGIELILIVVFSLGFYTGTKERTNNECKHEIVERHEESK